MSVGTRNSMADLGLKVEGCGLPENFPVGMKVLLVDDDLTCLAVIKRMLLNCQYTVTTCSRATEALSLLREDKFAFDLIVSDVHMPDMDGFRLLELVGLEMDLPVIMMSADTRFNIVMKGIKHGACDFLIKPVRMSELQNIWQHVVRRKWHDNKEAEHSASMDDSDHNQTAEDSEFPSSANDGSDGSSGYQKKKRDSKEEDDSELETTDPSSSKKPRVVWSVELHQQFVNAVNQLGIDKAVPKRILEMMNVPGLTRENVASHLQKFRLYLKRLSGVAQHHNLYGVASNGRPGQMPKHDLHTLTMSGQVPSQTLAALQDELLGRPPRNLAAIPALNQPILGQASIQGVKTERGIAFGSQSVSSSYQVWPSNDLGSVGAANSIGVNASQNRNMTGMILPQQQSHSFLTESQIVNVQPSGVIAPSRSTDKFQLQADSVLLKQNSHLLSPQSSPNPQAVKTFGAINQNSLVGASVSSKSFQRGNNLVGMNGGPVIMPSQPPSGISARTGPGLLNKTSIVIPSQPLASFQATNNPHFFNQNSVVVPSQQLTTFPMDNHLAQGTRIANMNNTTSAVDYSRLSSHLNNVNQSTSMGHAFDGSLNNSNLVNNYSVPGSASLSSYTTGWRVQSPDENVAHSVGSPSVGSSSCNIQATSRVLGSSGKLSDQGQARNLGFVGTGTSLPSRFAADDIDCATSDFSHIASATDEGYLLNQDPFVFNGALQSGHCTTSFE